MMKNKNFNYLKAQLLLQDPVNITDALDPDDKINYFDHKGIFEIPDFVAFKTESGDIIYDTLYISIKGSVEIDYSSSNGGSSITFISILDVEFSDGNNEVVDVSGSQNIKPLINRILL